ncbi:hypothetical protein ACN28C_09235 [Plantactinospora sp. WMMC1484]
MDEAYQDDQAKGCPSCRLHSLIIRYIIIGVDAMSTVVVAIELASKLFAG